MTDLPRYYAVWVSTSGRVSLRWSDPYDHPRDAQLRGRDEIDRGNASMALVVRVVGTTDKRVMVGRTMPTSARTAIEHYLDLIDAIEADD